MQYIPQISKQGCGIACLKMLLAIIQKDDHYLYLDEDENHHSYSYNDLILIAKRYEVTLLGVKVEDKIDLNHFNEFPLIVSVNNSDESKHALLLVKRKNNRVKIHDPNKGVYWQNINKFIATWDGTALIVKDYKNQPYDKTIIDLKNPKHDFLSYFLQSLTAICIALATLFIKPDGSFLAPIIFALASLFIEILLRVSLMKRMQKSDKYLRRFLPYVKSNDYFEYYKRSQLYKKSSLMMAINFVFYLLVVVLMITILLVNSLSLFSLIVISLLATYLDVFLFSPYKQNIIRDLENEENTFKNEKRLEKAQFMIKTMEVKSYQYAYLEIAKKIVVATIFVLASVLVSILKEGFFLTNIVFYTCVCFLLYQSLTPLFSFDQQREENLMNKVRLNNMIHHFDEKNSKQ